MGWNPVWPTTKIAEESYCWDKKKQAEPKACYRDSVCQSGNQLQAILLRQPSIWVRRGTTVGSEAQGNLIPVDGNPQINSAFAIRGYRCVEIQHLERDAAVATINVER